MDALLPHRPDGATQPGGYSSRRRMTAPTATIVLAVLALLGYRGTYHVLTDRVPASSSPPSAPSSSSSLPFAGVAKPFQTAREALRTIPPAVEAHTLLSTRAPAAQPPPSAAVDAAAAADAPRHPHYPLLGPVRKVVSGESGAPSLGAYSELDIGPSVRCMISDTYRFIYLSMPKAGSSSVRGHFLQFLCGRVKAGELPPTNCTAPVFNYWNGDTPFAFCKDVPRSKFSTYYVFSHVRNPWARAVSSYSFCRLRAARGISWVAWCADPDTDNLCHQHHDSAATAAGEQAALPPIARGSNRHWETQLPRLCTSSGECWVDYIGRTEELEAHFNTVLGVINERRDAGLPPLPPYRNKIRNARAGAAPPAAWYLPRSALSAADAAAADAAGVTPEPSCRAAVARYFAIDVEAFGSTFEEMVQRDAAAPLGTVAGASRG